MFKLSTILWRYSCNKEKFRSNTQTNLDLRGILKNNYSYTRRESWIKIKQSNILVEFIWHLLQFLTYCSCSSNKSLIIIEYTEISQIPLISRAVNLLYPHALSIFSLEIEQFPSNFLEICRFEPPVEIGGVNNMELCSWHHHVVSKRFDVNCYGSLEMVLLTELFCSVLFHFYEAIPYLQT